MLSHADHAHVPPFETEDLRQNLSEFLAQPFHDPEQGRERAVGSFKWGVYAFFDYDGEPIYVGQTKEKLSTRIRRHLTNQRTDAVAMSVLDPFEVYEIEVWPLPQFEKTSAKDADAKAHLDALEDLIYQDAIAKSRFKAVLNEKDPPARTLQITAPPSLRYCIVSDQVHRIRSHPDFRIARRALIISRLAQVISERKVQGGLRRVMLTQSKRLQWLAQRRFDGLGGDDLLSLAEADDD
jgi:hypothetical protein